MSELLEGGNEKVGCTLADLRTPPKAPLPTPSHFCLEGRHGPDTGGRKAGKWWPVCPSEIGAMSREEGVDRVGSGKALPWCLSSWLPLGLGEGAAGTIAGLVILF